MNNEIVISRKHPRKLLRNFQGLKVENKVLIHININTKIPIKNNDSYIYAAWLIWSVIL